MEGAHTENPTSSSNQQQSKQSKSLPKGWEVMALVMLVWATSIPVIGVLVQELSLSILKNIGNHFFYRTLTTPYRALSNAFNKERPNRITNFLKGVFLAIFPIHNWRYLLISPVAFIASIGLMIKDLVQWIVEKVSNSKQPSLTTPETEEQTEPVSDDSALTAGAKFTPLSDAAHSATSSATNDMEDNSLQSQPPAHKNDASYTPY